MSEPSAQGLYPAEHRALRELYAMARQLSRHWTRLGERLDEPTLTAGAAEARALIRELEDRTAPHGLHGFPAAQGAGGRIADLRNHAADLLLERNQALRAATLDVAHVATLLAYLSALAEQRGDAALGAWHKRWEIKMRDVADDVLGAVVRMASDPGAAIEPASPTRAGRIGAGIGNGLGTVGEAVDGSLIGRAARRATGR